MGKKQAVDYSNLLQSLKEEESNPFDKPEVVVKGKEQEPQTNKVAGDNDSGKSIDVAKANENQEQYSKEGETIKIGLVDRPKSAFVKGGVTALADIKDLVMSSLATVGSSKAVNVYVDDSTDSRLLTIENALRGDPSIGKRGNRKVVLKLVVDFFYEHFGDEVEKREARALKERQKRANV